MNDQASDLREKLAARNSSKQAKTISIISGKGGVGKSSTAVNFALELRHNDKKVLIIDLDIGMGNVDIMIGLHAKKTLNDLFNDRLTIHEIIDIGPRNLSYIAGGSGLNNLFTLSKAKKSYFYEQYNELIMLYDYIIFDMGAGVTRESLFFILASDECIVITTPEPTALTDAYSTMKHIVNNRKNMPIYIVMNRAKTERDGRKSLEQLKQIIYRFLDVDIQIMGVLPEDKIVSQSIIKQTPYVLLNNRSKVSKALKKMTVDYLAEFHKKDKERIKPATFTQKLKLLLKDK